MDKINTKNTDSLVPLFELINRVHGTNIGGRNPDRKIGRPAEKNKAPRQRTEQQLDLF